MYLPGTFATALPLTILSAIFWGSWANTYKGTKHYAFEHFYWDYILGVVLCSWVFALTLGSNGSAGEPFLANVQSAEASNIGHALIADVQPKSDPIGSELASAEPSASSGMLNDGE